MSIWGQVMGDGRQTAKTADSAKNPAAEAQLDAQQRASIQLLLDGSRGLSDSRGKRTSDNVKVPPMEIGDASREIPKYKVVDKGDQNFVITFQSEGRERSFEAHVPKNLKPNAPMMLVLHGGNPGSAEGVMSKITGMNQLADKNGFIAVYPLSLDPTHRGMNSWNSDNTLSGQANPLYDDVNYIKHLINVTALQFKADQKHLAVVGFSDGGAFANHLVSKLDGKVDFIATVSGTVMQGEPVGRKPPGKALFIQTGGDPWILPDAGGPGIITGFNAQKGFPLIPELPNVYNSKPFMQASQYAENPQWMRKVGPTNTRGVEEFVNQGPKTSVELIHIPTAQHGWPASSVSWPVIGEAFKGLNASERIVQSWIGPTKLPSKIQLK